MVAWVEAVEQRGGTGDQAKARLAARVARKSDAEQHRGHRSVGRRSGDQEAAKRCSKRNGLRNESEGARRCGAQSDVARRGTAAGEGTSGVGRGACRGVSIQGAKRRV